MSLPAEEVFRWKELSIVQHENVFKVGTDALLLGAWIPHVVASSNAILDIGTGTGILSLMMQRVYKGAHILAIDQQEEAVRLAGCNFSNSTNPLAFTCGLKDVFDLSPATKFDLIVCNPPYFFSPSHLHQGPYSHARHAKENPHAWMEKMTSLIRDDGHACLVLPFAHAAEWIKAANDAGLFVNHRKNISSFISDAEPKRVLLHFTNKIRKPILSKMHMYNEHGQYSAEYEVFAAGDDL